MHKKFSSSKIKFNLYNTKSFGKHNVQIVQKFLKINFVNV